VFINAGMSQDRAMMMAGVDSIVYFLGAVTPIYTIERWGRRKLMYLGLISQMVTLIIVGVCQWQVQNGNDGASIGVIVGVFLYNFAFGAAWLGLAWLYPSEIFSTGMRAKGNSMSTGANWLGNFVVAEITPVLFEYAKFWTFIMFALLNFVVRNDKKKQKMIVMFTDLCSLFRISSSSQSISGILKLWANPWKKSKFCLPLKKFKKMLAPMLLVLVVLPCMTQNTMLNPLLNVLALTTANNALILVVCPPTSLVLLLTLKNPMKILLLLKSRSNMMVIRSLVPTSSRQQNKKKRKCDMVEQSGRILLISVI
jgi:MFS family permease